MPRAIVVVLLLVASLIIASHCAITLDPELIAQLSWQQVRFYDELHDNIVVHDGEVAHFDGSTVHSRSVAGSPTPTTISALGGVMRIDTPYHDFSKNNWKREIALLFDMEVTEVLLLAARPGSTVIYFQIDDPPRRAVASGMRSTLGSLSGDDKMLLLYQWWVRRDVRLDEVRDYTINHTIALMCDCITNLLGVTL
jgi:hypothetical protein